MVNSCLPTLAKLGPALLSQPRCHPLRASMPLRSSQATEATTTMVSLVQMLCSLGEDGGASTGPGCTSRSPAQKGSRDASWDEMGCLPPSDPGQGMPFAGALSSKMSESEDLIQLSD